MKIDHHHLLLCLLAGALLLFSHCTPKPVVITEAPSLKRLTPSEYPHFEDQFDYDRLSDGIAMSLVHLRRLPAHRTFAFGPDTYSAAHVIASLEAFAAIIEAQPDAATLNRIIAQRFRVYEAAGNPSDRQVLYTGYYEPILQGSRRPSSEFSVPLYAKPSDLVEIDLSAFGEDLKGRRIVGRYNGQTVVPYPPREEIRGQVDFHRLAPPLAWVRDEYDLFNLQIQGSGQVALDDGVVLQVSYAGSNGHPYRSVARLLIDQGKISAGKMSMQAIRNYLRDHPEQLHAILNHNPRYIFFRQVDQGPIGALGVPLTAARSIAVDRTLFPLAALVFVKTDIPLIGERDTIAGRTTYSGFALAQDTGSAITGPGRADFFWGSGTRAELAAGHMKYNGQLFFLVLEPKKDET